MDISKNSILRFVLDIGVIISSVNIHNYVYFHFLYAIRSKILCPALGPVSMCELGIQAGTAGIVTGNALICLLLLKSTKTLHHSRVLNRLETLICTVQVPAQMWLGMYFACMAADAGSHEDGRILIFISFFGLIALFFAIAGILSYLEEFSKERFRD